MERIHVKTIESPKQLEDAIMGIFGILKAVELTDKKIDELVSSGKWDRQVLKHFQHVGALYSEVKQAIIQPSFTINFN